MRTILLPRERLARWVAGFGERHGDTTWAAESGRVNGTAADGAEAQIMINAGPAVPGDQPTSLLTQVSVDLDLGVLLVRKGGYAIGVARGGQVTDHTGGTSYVQSRTKAGGWSQQRYARRRGNQATRAYAKAAGDAARLLASAQALDRLVCGGDRVAIEAVLDDPRLTALRPRWDGRVFGVADPRWKVLQEFVPVALGVTIRLNDAATR